MLLSKRILVILGIGSLLIGLELLALNEFNGEMKQVADGLGTLFQGAGRFVDIASAGTKLSRALPTSQSFNEQRPATGGPSREKSSEQIVNSIDQYCAEIQTRDRKKQPDSVFGFTASSDEHPGHWLKYASTSELEKSSERESFDQQAYVWEEEGKVVAANFTLESGSGDWALYPIYCFRRDGTTAEISSELRTFYGMMIVRRIWVFDSKGKLLKSSEEFLDLKTEKPKNPEPDDEFIDEGTPIYHKVADLPFLSLLPDQ